MYEGNGKLERWMRGREGNGVGGGKQLYLDIIFVFESLFHTL